MNSQEKDRVALEDKLVNIEVADEEPKRGTKGNAISVEQSCDQVKLKEENKRLKEENELLQAENEQLQEEIEQLKMNHAMEGAHNHTEDVASLQEQLSALTNPAQNQQTTIEKLEGKNAKLSQKKKVQTASRPSTQESPSISWHNI